MSQAGHNPVPVSFSDGSRLLLLPAGGRMLGLCPAGDDENFLWLITHYANPQGGLELFDRITNFDSNY